MRKSGPERFVVVSSPQHDTAFHLAVPLREQPDELLAAYKLLAASLEAGVRAHVLSAVAPVFERHGFGGQGWWHHGARFVLPPHSATYFDHKYRTDEFLAFATRAWTEVAAEYAVVRVPDFLEVDDPVREAYSRHVAETSAKREREEYERLRRKFEGKSDQVS